MTNQSEVPGAGAAAKEYATKKSDFADDFSFYSEEKYVAFLAGASWAVGENARLREALENIIKSWEAGCSEKEQLKTIPEFGVTYWSPASSMISSEFIAAARKALLPTPPIKNKGGEE